MVFYARSDWLLKLSAVHLQALLWLLRANYSPFVGSRVTIFGWLSTGLVHTTTIIHLSIGKEWLDIYCSANIRHSSPPLRWIIVN